MNPKLSRHREQGNRSGLGMAFFFVTLAAIVVLSLNSGYFDLRDIQVEGCQWLSRAEVLTLSGLDQPVNVLTISPGVVCKLISRDPRVRSVTVVRKLPGTVIIHIKEREPLLAIPYAGDFVWISVDRVVLPAAVNRRYPFLTGAVEENLRLGERITSPVILAAGDFVQYAPEALRGRIREINIEQPEQIMMFLLDGVTVELGASESARRKMEVLDVLVNDSVRRGKKLVYANLRSPHNPTVRWND